MKRTMVTLAAGLMLAGGLALAQSGSADPAGEAAASGAGQDLDHGRGDAMHRGGEMRRGGGYGRHGEGGRGGHGGGRSSIWKADGAGFEFRIGGTGGLRVNCGDTDIAACIAASQALLDAMAAVAGAAE